MTTAENQYVNCYGFGKNVFNNNFLFFTDLVMFSTIFPPPSPDLRQVTVSTDEICQKTRRDNYHETRDWGVKFHGSALKIKNEKFTPLKIVGPAKPKKSVRLENTSGRKNSRRHGHFRIFGKLSFVYPKTLLKTIYTGKFSRFSYHPVNRVRIYMYGCIKKKHQNSTILIVSGDVAMRSLCIHTRVYEVWQ